jgi:ubiquinone/menaquinone biosynthesis C-methylase UbiE
MTEIAPVPKWDHSTEDAFFQYYKDASTTEHTRRRLTAYRDIVVRFHPHAFGGAPVDVGDIGCGAGTQSFIWASLGHRTHGVDISAQLVALARERAAASVDGHLTRFEVGSATKLPWPAASVDVALAIELLEHVAEWESCLDECVRVLRPNGVLFLTTTNVLCPKQQEFDLPLYSWYPGIVKRYYERLARTTRPELATFATYPAVNWFTPYGLRRELEQRGCKTLDRFQVIDHARKTRLKGMAMRVIQTNRVVRFAAHLVTPATWVLAVKE